MSDPMTPEEEGLYRYMVGWRLGARGSSLTPYMAKNAHSQSGWEDGRASQKQAYEKACLDYGTKLDLIDVEIRS